MPLQSAIFTINRKFIINLVSCISTALVAYGIRFILLKYVEYDVFANIENWRASLGYFFSLAGIRFIITEYLKESNFLMSYCGGPSPVSNNTAGTGSLPVGSNAAGYNSSMQAPDNSATNSATSSSIPRYDFTNLNAQISKMQEHLDFMKSIRGSTTDTDVTIDPVEFKSIDTITYDKYKHDYELILAIFKDGGRDCPDFSAFWEDIQSVIKAPLHRPDNDLLTSDPFKYWKQSLSYYRKEYNNINFVVEIMQQYVEMYEHRFIHPPEDCYTSFTFLRETGKECLDFNTKIIKDNISRSPILTEVYSKKK